MVPETLEKITELIKQLRYECYTARIPMIAMIQYEADNKPVILAETISPALVKYENGSPLFYDFQNLLHGGFKTVPKISKEEEYID